VRFPSVSAAAVSIFALAACSEPGPTSPVAEGEIPELPKLAEAASFPAAPLRTVSQMAEGLDPMACVAAVRQAGRQRIPRAPAENRTSLPRPRLPALLL
jgi:hypothetical protein